MDTTYLDLPADGFEVAEGRGLTEIRAILGFRTWRDRSVPKHAERVSDPWNCILGCSVRAGDSYGS